MRTARRGRARAWATSRWRATTASRLAQDARGSLRRAPGPSAPWMFSRLREGGGRVHFSQTHPTCHHLIRCACSMRQSEGLFLSCSEDARRSRDLFATDRFLRPDSARGGRKLVATVGSAREEDDARRQPSAGSLALAASLFVGEDRAQSRPPPLATPRAILQAEGLGAEGSPKAVTSSAPPTAIRRPRLARSKYTRMAWISERNTRGTRSVLTLTPRTLNARTLIQFA